MPGVTAWPLLIASVANSSALKKPDLPHPTIMNPADSSTAAKIPPHSVEAEEHLLSCCLVDEGDSIQRCIDGGITGAFFYSPVNGAVYSTLCELHVKVDRVDVAILAEELKRIGKFDAVGGIDYVMRISGLEPTTVKVRYWISQVRELHALRELIKVSVATIEGCHNFREDLDAFTAQVEQDVLRVTQDARPQEKGLMMDWDSLLTFDGKNDPDCLMGNRFLCRTGGCVIVAPSGVGKSVIALQLGACAALERHFFGMKMAKPMRVLYIQAEDDAGDVAEAAQGFRDGFKLTADELLALRQRLRIVRWNDAAGEKFLTRLRQEHSKWPFDLVIINPLFSFAGCNVSEQRDLSPFLRNGLNPILNETGAAAIIVHHTNKPPTDQRNKPADINAELRYIGSGSAELTNWSRAYITLQGIASAGDGVFKMSLAKRGLRAGIAGDDGKLTTSIYIEHAQRGLCWLPSNWRPEKGTGGKFLAKFDLQRALRVYDSTIDWAENERRIAADQEMEPRSIRHHRQSVETAA